MIKIVVFQNPSRPSVPRKLKSNIQYIIVKAAERKRVAARIGIFQPATVRWHRHDVKLMSCHKEGEIFAMQSQPKLYEVMYKTFTEN